jgi:hypothetical protein
LLMNMPDNTRRHFGAEFTRLSRLQLEDELSSRPKRSGAEGPAVRSDLSWKCFSTESAAESRDGIPAEVKGSRQLRWIRATESRAHPLEDRTIASRTRPTEARRAGRQTSAQPRRAGLASPHDLSAVGAAPMFSPTNRWRRGSVPEGSEAENPSARLLKRFGKY